MSTRNGISCYWFRNGHVSELTEQEKALIRSSPAENENSEYNSETGVRPSASNNDIDEADVNNSGRVSSTESEAESLSYFLNLLQELNEKFSSSKEGIRKTITRLQKRKSPSQ